MGIIGIIGLVGFIAAWIRYGNWLEAGIRPRRLVTALSPHDARVVFVNQVARAGWKIVDDGDPIVAQSSLATGIRQQIGMQVATTNDGRTVIRIGPERWVTRYGIPKKGHTIRMRMNSFVGAVQTYDPSARVQAAA